MLTIIGTFDVQRVKITEDDTSTCFQCVYVDGTSARGCFIEYICAETIYNGNLNVSGSERTCKPDINLSNYTIKVYDEESNGTIYTHTPAYLIESTKLGRILPFTHGTLISTPTSSVISFTVINSPDISSSPKSKTIKGQKLLIMLITKHIICPFSRYYSCYGNHCSM